MEIHPRQLPRFSLCLLLLWILLLWTAGLAAAGKAARGSTVTGVESLPIDTNLITVLASERNNTSETAQDKYNRLKHLKLLYADEIFDYCVDELGSFHSGLASCMARQKRLQDKIFDRALDLLGRQSLAQSVYADCLDLHPASSMRLIGKCVDIRLELRQRLDHPKIEKQIYASCQQLWRKHSIGAVRNCSLSDASYYLSHGELRN